MNLQELDDFELDELAADVRSFVNSKAFKLIFESRREAYVQELVSADVGSLTAGTAHASMKVLEDVKNSFSLITNEQSVRRKKTNARHR